MMVLFRCRVALVLPEIPWFLDSPVQCTDNRSHEMSCAEDGSIITFSCEVSYHGLWAPRLTWYDGDFPIGEAANESSHGVVKYTFSREIIAGMRNKVSYTETVNTEIS